jgi:hypothetical protein
MVFRALLVGTIYNFVRASERTEYGPVRSLAYVEGPVACEACGRQLPPQEGRGRQRRYCGATCRSAARRARALASPPARATVNSARRTINDALTPERRHGKVYAVDAVSDEAGSVAVRVDNAARWLVDQLAHPRDPAPLDAVAAARELSASAGEALRVAVTRARQASHSWGEIGDVLGTTRQAAFQRFGRPVDPRTGTPMAQALLPDAADRAVALAVCLVEGRWEELRRDFDETMRERLDAARIASAWAQAVGMVGRYESMGEPFAHQAGDYTVVDVPLHCEAGELTGQVSYDRDGKVAGLFILPSRP